jgi:hypothetical protein
MPDRLGGRLGVSPDCEAPLVPGGGTVIVHSRVKQARRQEEGGPRSVVSILFEQD